MQVDYGVNLPRSCCKENKFECELPVMQCRNLQLITSTVFICLVSLFAVNLICSVHGCFVKVKK